MTALHDVHVRAGASFTQFAGWTMPVRYRSDVEEHHAVRRSAGLFDLSHMGQVDVVGPGAADALDAAVVGWISKVEVGRAKYTMMCDDDGGVVDDLVVYRPAEQRFLVVANAGNHSAVLGRLEGTCAAFDAVVADRSATHALIAVQGPLALRTLEQVTDAAVADLRYYAVLRGEVAGVPVEIARTGYTGEDGFEVYVEQQAAPQVWAALRASGTGAGLLPAGLACRDTLRLEAGMPLYGHELTRELTPFDAGLGRVVAFDKPAHFTGRKALQELASRPAARVLSGLALEGRRIARSGQDVLDPATGEVVGRVTSGAPSPTLGHPIAMAFLDAAVAAVGVPLTVDVRGRHEPCRTAALPFYRRSR